MDIDEDEIDDLDDIRKIMQETQRETHTQSFISTYTEPTSSEIVPFNPDVLEKNTVLQRSSIETNFRQPTTISTYSSAGPHYNLTNSNSGGFTTDIPLTTNTATSSSFSSFYNRNDQQQKNDQQTGQQHHTFSAPSSSSMPESLFNSQTRTRPSTFSSDIADSNPMSFSSTISSLSGSAAAAGPFFPKKTSCSDFKSLTRNSNSYYNRQPNSVFSSTSSNANSDYRFRPVELPVTNFSKPYFPDDADKQKQTGNHRNLQSDKDDVSNNATSTSYVPAPDSLSNMDEQNPTLLGLMDSRHNNRPHSRPKTQPPKQIKHMADEIRRSSERPKSSDKTINNSFNKVSDTEHHHSSRPHHREHITEHVSTSNERPLAYSPLSPTNSTPRTESPVSRFNSSTAINPKVDARPLGLQVRASSNTAATNKMDKTGKIPKRSFNKQRDDITSMTMLQLLGKKKDINSILGNLNENRQNLERKKSDIERSSRGSYYDNDPQHRHLRDQLTSLSAKERELKSQLNCIWDRLESQFNLKRTADPTNRHASKPDQTKKSRPKMSTTPSGPVEPPNRLERESHLSNTQLNLEDRNNWCQICDVHMKSLKEYCMHIHSEGHSEKTKNKTRPWSKVTTEFLTKGETLEVIDKVVKAEAERKGANLSIDDFKAIFDQSKYKSTKKPDKGEPSENSEDPGEKVSEPEMNVYRGQRFLIPTIGAYCTLCDRGFFDDNDVEYHMRSYEHTVAHTRMVFIDPLIESNYHRDMNRSLERLKASKNTSDRSRYQENLQGLLEAREKKERDRRRRILDDEPRKLQKSRVPSPKSRKRANIETDSSASESPIKKKQNTNRDRATEISRKQLSRELELSDDSNDDTPTLSQSIMQHNDPDSPFPGLILEVHGNTHTELLLDKRLRQQTFVAIEKIDIKDPTYARLLSSENELNRLDSSATLFNTIVKAEPFDWTLAKPTYFDKLGDQIPITLDSNNDTDDNGNIFDALVKQEKPDKPSNRGISSIVKEEGIKGTSGIDDITNIKTEKSAPTKRTEPEVIKLFSDDEEEPDCRMIDIDSNLLSSCTDSEEVNNVLPSFNPNNTFTSKSMEFTSTIPERNPEGTLNSIAINNDSSNDNLGGIIFDTKSEASSPTARSSSPPLDNIIISNHSPSSNLVIPTTLGDTSIEDQSIASQMVISVSMVQPTTSTHTTHATDALSRFEKTANPMPLAMPTTYSIPSCESAEINQHVPTKTQDMDCGSSSINFNHENTMVDSVNNLDVDLGNNFQTPNLSDLSDPLVNTFTGDPHLNSL